MSSEREIETTHDAETSREEKEKAKNAACNSGLNA
jgi:hypothetical protein